MIIQAAMNASTTPVDTPAPSTSQVSWQTIFWTLVCLAINTMSQPGGRICGLQSRYRTYLRCSPLVCLADMLSIILWFIINFCFHRLSLAESLGIVLHERFNERRPPVSDSTIPDLSLEDTETEGVQALEKMIWLRWLWFILGTLPSVFKLMFMSGVAWIQAWGMIFLVSWIMNESLIIFATANQSLFTISSTGRISWSGYELTTRSSIYKRLHRGGDRVERFLALTALIVHVVIMNGVFRVILRKTNAFPLQKLRYQYLKSSTTNTTIFPTLTQRVFSTNLLPYHISVDPFYPRGYATKPNFVWQSPQWSYRYTSPGYIFLVTLAIWLGIFMILFIFRLRIKELKLSIIPLGLFYLMLVNTATNTCIYGRISYTSPYVFIISIIIIIIFLFFIRLLSRRFVMFGQNLLVIYPRGGEELLSIDDGACLALAFFITTVVATLCWYRFVFDTSNTYAPSWAGVFG